MKRIILTALVVFAMSPWAQARIVRAADVSPAMWRQIESGKAADTVIEFRQGDELPITLTAEGDLVETVRSGVTSIAIKRTFWLRILANVIEISLDGSTFKPIPQVLSGSVEVGANSDASGAANGMNVLFRAVLKGGR